MKKRLKPSADVLVGLGALLIFAVAAAGTAALRQDRAGATPAQRWEEVAPPQDLVTIAGTKLDGSASSPVVVLEFVDFQCPYCQEFALQTLPALKARYTSTGKVLFGVRHLPLPIHPFATVIAETAECAATQGKFWPVHDLLFRSPVTTRLTLRQKVANVIDGPLLERCLSDDAPAAVRREVDEATSVGIVSTPTFLIGRVEIKGQIRVVRMIAGLPSETEFASMLDQELGREQSGR